MSNANIVGSLSKLFENPVSNFWLAYDGYLLGKSTGTLEYTPEFDVKDIIYTQDGTKAEDHLYTGADHMVSITLSEKVNENLFDILVPGWEHVVNSNNPQSVITKELYVSLRDTRGRVLQIISALPDGSPSEDPNDIITLYVAIPLIESAIFKFGADQQQEMPVNFRCKTEDVANIQGSTITSLIYNGKQISKVFGYLGEASLIGLPEAVIVDRSGPELLSAEATTATALNAVFNKDLDLTFEGNGYAYSGDVSGNLAGFQATNDFSINVAIDGGGPLPVLAIDTSSVLGLNEVAPILQVAIRAADPSLAAVTVLYNGGQSRFEIISSLAGITSAIALTANVTGTDLLDAAYFDGSTSVAGKNGIKTVEALTVLVSNNEESKFVIPASASINVVNENEVDFVFPASSFAAGDILTIFLAADLCADTSGNINQPIGIGTTASNSN